MADGARVDAEVTVDLEGGGAVEDLGIGIGRGPSDCGDLVVVLRLPVTGYTKGASGQGMKPREPPHRIY